MLALERWGWQRGWSGPDPYEGLSARRPGTGVLRRTALGRRLLIQLVKRSPLDLRRPLGIPAALDAASVAHLLSAYSRLEALGEPLRRERARWALKRLEDLSCPGYDEPCWGYHFDVETRFFGYAVGTPNTIATSFAGLALLDAHGRDRDTRALELAESAGEFFLRHVPLTEAENGGGAYFGYLSGDRTPIHNANLLACSLLAELAACCDREDFGAAARAGLRYALARQRPDGSWPYAETPTGDWVDGFHTGYVLDALRRCGRALSDPSAEAAYRRGLAHYASRLFEADGAPRYRVDRRYPIDSICIAQGISSFCLASELQGGEEWLDAAWRVYGFGARRMRRRDGAFAFQRRRLWVNRAPHVRWVQAPMLDALARLLAASGGGSAPGQPG